MEGLTGQARSGVERHNVAENDFFRINAGVFLQVFHDNFHFGEHFGSAEFGDDEIVGEERVTKWFGIWVMRVRVEEELKS